MPSTFVFQTSVSGILSAGGTKSISNDSAEIVNPVNVLAAQPATLSARTSQTAGTLTMTNSSHGVVTGQRIDLYWEGGSAFGITAGTVSGTSIPFTVVQGGDPLPAINTAIIVGIAQSVSFSLTGNDVKALLCSRANASVRSYWVFLEAAGILALAVLNQTGETFVWDGTTEATGPLGSGSGNPRPAGRNPLAGTSPIEVYVSHANTASNDTTLSTAVIKT